MAAERLFNSGLGSAQIEQAASSKAQQCEGAGTGTAVVGIVVSWPAMP